MTSPREPDQPGAGEDPAGGDAPVEAEHAAAKRTRSTAQRTTQSRSRQAKPAGHSPGVDDRLSRFITGTAAPGVKPRPTPPADGDGGAARQPGAPPDGYGSELPDLSGPKPRSPRAVDTERSPAKTPPAGGTARGVERPVQVTGRARGPVRASMQIRRVDPWSTLKVSLLLSVALFFAWMIAVAFLYLLLGSMGVWDKLNSNVGDLLNNAGGTGELVSSGTIFGAAALIGLVNVVLFTAMATIGAVVYNLTTDLVGGIEVTLADRD